MLDTHDAKGQDTVYSYDTTNRVTMIQYFPQGKNNAEDMCARVAYSYGTARWAPQYNYGRLASVQYGCQVGWRAPFSGNSASGPQYTESYSYHPAGAVTAKQLQFSRPVFDSSIGAEDQGTGTLEADYTYDFYGRTASLKYLLPGSNTPSTMTYGYDSMGRPAFLTDPVHTSWVGSQIYWAQNAQYDYASRMTGLQILSGLQYNTDGTFSSPPVAYTSKTMAYNVNGQLSSLAWGNTAINYTYAATQNNGQITQAADFVSGESITYQYDALKRLVSASSTPVNGSSPPAWTQTYQYDGFGNLTAKVLNGSTTMIPVTAATNQLSSASYDVNGNMISGAGAGLAYDEANRISGASPTGGGSIAYAYDAANKQIYRDVVKVAATARKVGLSTALKGRSWGCIACLRRCSSARIVAGTISARGFTHSSRSAPTSGSRGT